VPYAFLAVTIFGAIAVALSYRPIRREPLTVVSFVMASWTGELAIQNIIWQLIATAVFIEFGALDAWAGWLGLAFAVAGWVGLAGLGLEGLRAADVTAAALSEVRSDTFPVPTQPTAPTWGRWWRVTRAIPMKSRAVEATRHVDYWGDGSPRHRLDVYRSRLVPRQNAPVVVYVHGGGWMIGEKREQGKPMMFELVARGWVCVTINYRLSPKATWPDHIIDVKRALTWVKQHIAEYGGDPSFIAISGGSAGGHLCALAALSAGDAAFQPGFEEADASVQACVPFYGVMDLTSSPEGSAIFGPGLVEMLEKTVMKVKESDQPEVFRAASPTYRVNPGAPPFFVLQGENDTLVPVEMARTFVKRLRAVSRSAVAYAELPLAQHAFDVVASLRCQATTSAVGDFLEAAHAAHMAAGPSAIDAPVTRIVSDIESPPGI
jgi:acetyl esterase/lipase